ncbi:hypothetical protein [Mastigocladopsis repens]|uniref:hypothetical protein n=1 Tax=Mastigocladopsis repens TaxID=221287 RepID=UPI0002E12A85|nr:hypothetical protein [Mastigocladopsis repens]
MAEPTLTEVFGLGASQTDAQLIISKADLAAVGLTPAANNRAEQLFVALLLKVQAYLNPTSQETNPDIQIIIEEGTFPSIVFRNNQNYRQTTYTVNLQKLDNSSAIDPDDY